LPLREGNGHPPLDFVPSAHFVPGAQAEKADKEAPDGGIAIATKFIIPVGLAVSCIAHLALLTPAAYFAGANPFDTAPADAITVDIVSPEEEAQETPKQEAAAADSTLSLGASSPAAPSPAAPAEPSPQPQPPSPPASRAIQQDAIGQAAAQAQSAEQAVLAPAWLPQQFAAAAPEPGQQETDITNMFAMPLTLPDGTVGGKYDAQAEDRANISNDSIAAFRSHLKTCSTLPAGRLASDVRVVLRVYLKPDGSLAKGLPQNPEVIKVDAVSTGGGALFQSAAAAVRKCQPYRMLPPDKYEEWKQLDLTFTPQNF
jgi:hypothetical protein